MIYNNPEFEKPVKTVDFCRSRGRQFARGAVRRRVQHPLAAADDSQEGRALFADAFFAPAGAQRFDCNGAVGGEGSGEIRC